MNPNIFKKIEKFVIILFFLTLIFVPFVVGIIKPDRVRSKREKRNLVQLPANPRTIEDVVEYPKRFDSYYSDQFGLRKLMVQNYKLLQNKIGDSSSRRVIVGKDGWWFSGSISEDTFDDVIDDYRNKNMFTQEELKDFATNIQCMKDYLDSVDIKYVYVVVPVKHNVYPEKLPSYITKVGDVSAADQLVNYLTNHTDVSIVDLRGVMVDAKSQTDLYFRKDTHWNYFGSNIAQFEIMKVLQGYFPDISAEYGDVRYQGTRMSDLTSMMGVTGRKFREPETVLSFENEVELKRINFNDGVRDSHMYVSSNTNGLSALVFRDSFFSALKPFFQRNFQYSTYIWTRADCNLFMKYSKLHKPDVVIEECLERFLPYVPDHRSFGMLSHDSEFSDSEFEIFSNNWDRVRANKYIDVKENISGLEVKVIGKYPILSLLPINISTNSYYFVKIKADIKDDAYMKLFNSDSSQMGKDYISENNIPISDSDKSVFLKFDGSEMGKFFRIGIFNAKKSLIINEFQIRKVDK